MALRERHMYVVKNLTTFLPYYYYFFFFARPHIQTNVPIGILTSARVMQNVFFFDKFGIGGDVVIFIS